MAQSSDKASRVAAKVLGHQMPTGLTPAELKTADPKGLFVSRDYAEELLRDAKVLAGSVLRQDETKGLRRLLRKVGL